MALQCEICNLDMVISPYTSVTMVGCLSPPCEYGFVHDDNCRVYTYTCSSGHVKKLSPINRCKCGWICSTECFCSTKVEALP